MKMPRPIVMRFSSVFLLPPPGIAQTAPPTENLLALQAGEILAQRDQYEQLETLYRGIVPLSIFSMLT